MATQLAFLYMLDLGCGERPIDFVKDYRASWLGLGVLGKFGNVCTFITCGTNAGIDVLTFSGRKILCMVVIYICTLSHIYCLGILCVMNVFIQSKSGSVKTNIMLN
jgi:hypothetical protein